ncbi:hypothetical protein TKK_0006386 [Trichogramma kaykai]
MSLINLGKEELQCIKLVNIVKPTNLPPFKPLGSIDSKEIPMHFLNYKYSIKCKFLQVSSNILKCPIKVIQATEAPYLVGSEFESERKLTLTYHRNMYHLGAHYNFLSKYVKAAES